MEEVSVEEVRGNGQVYTYIHIVPGGGDYASCCQIWNRSAYVLTPVRVLYKVSYISKWKCREYLSILQSNQTTIYQDILRVIHQRIKSNEGSGS